MDEIIAKLPPLPEIPPLNLPFDIPALAHPAVVHFAIAIPILVLLFEVVNTFAKKRALSVSSLLMLILLVVVALGAYLSGGVDGKVVGETLSGDAMETLKEHKMLGLYIVYASAVVLIFKLLSMLLNAGVVRFLFILILIGYTAMSLYQGKEGGELVYKHGAHVAKAKELDDKLFDLEDAMDDLKSKSAETIKALESNLTTLRSSMPDTAAIEADKAKLNATIEALTNEKTEVLKELNSMKESTSSEVTKLTEQIKTLENEKEKANTQIEELKKALDEAKKVATTPVASVPVETPSRGVNQVSTASESSAN